MVFRHAPIPRKGSGNQQQQQQDADQLIAKAKLTTVKNRIRQARVATTDCLSQLFSRWRSWLNAASCYAKNLPEVEGIVESFEVSGILVPQAKISLQTGFSA